MACKTQAARPVYLSIPSCQGYHHPFSTSIHSWFPEFAVLLPASRVSPNLFSSLLRVLFPLFLLLIELISSESLSLIIVPQVKALTLFLAQLIVNGNVQKNILLICFFVKHFYYTVNCKLQESRNHFGLFMLSALEPGWWSSNVCKGLIWCCSISYSYPAPQPVTPTLSEDSQFPQGSTSSVFCSCGHY